MTSIKLEDAFWQFLDESASDAKMSWADFARCLLDDIGSTENRAASIKETLLRLAIGEKSVRGRAEDTETLGRWALVSGGSEDTVVLPRMFLWLGRSPMCDLIINDPACSKVHAALFPINDHWWVADVGSKNGVWRKGERIWSARVDCDLPFVVGDTEVAPLN